MKCPDPPVHGGDGGPGIGPVLFLLGAALLVSAFGWVLNIIAIALAVAGVVLLGGLVGLVLWHTHKRLGAAVPVWQRTGHIRPPRQRPQMPPGRPQEAVQGGQHVHIHLSGLSASERTEALRQLRGGR